MNKTKMRVLQFLVFLTTQGFFPPNETLSTHPQRAFSPLLYLLLPNCLQLEIIVCQKWCFTMVCLYSQNHHPAHQDRKWFEKDLCSTDFSLHLPVFSDQIRQDGRSLFSLLSNYTLVSGRSHHFPFCISFTLSNYYFFFLQIFKVMQSLVFESAQSGCGLADILF